MALELLESDPDIAFSSMGTFGGSLGSGPPAQASESTFTTFVLGFPGAVIGNR